MYINGSISDFQTIEYGVPQGSVLGPLLFLLYINDVSNAIPELKVKLFADDTNIFIFNNNIETMFTDANLALSKLNTWFNVNKLVLNTEKTQYCIFKKPNSFKKGNDILYPDLKLDNNIINRVKSTKYVGIVIDEFLTFFEHIENLVGTIKRFCGIFYKFRKRLPFYCLKAIYIAMIHSHINYGIEIYANTTKSFLDPLIKMNNKILRILQDKPIRTPVDFLYKNYDSLTILQSRDIAIVCLVHKFVNNVQVLPEIYQHYFSFNYELHTYRVI